MHYLLIYETSKDYMARRAEFRVEHLTKAWQAVERGELVLGGPVGDPVESAMLLFKCDSAAVPTHFAETDPYVLNGLVDRWTVNPWNTVTGKEASNPVRVD